MYALPKVTFADNQRGVLSEKELSQVTIEAKRELAESKLPGIDRIHVLDRTHVEVHYGGVSHGGGAYLLIERINGVWKTKEHIVWNS
jgi:hypothetical protein